MTVSSRDHGLRERGGDAAADTKPGEAGAVVTRPPLDPVAVSAASALAETSEYVVRVSGHHGQAEAMLRLRMRGLELRRAALAEDQIRSLACAAAADDLARGLPPLGRWMARMTDAGSASPGARAAIRELVPAGAVARDVQDVLREVSARCLHRSADAFDAALALPACLEAAARLQAAAWDDPRLEASPEMRAVMRSSAALLRREASRLRPAGSARTPTRGDHAGAWRKLARWRCWLEGSGGERV